MPFAKFNNIEIYYEILGAQNTENVLLISGLGSQMTSWSESFCEALVQQGYRVIRFDNRDSGRSTHIQTGAGSATDLMLHLQQKQVPENAYTLLDMAKDTIALLDFLAIERVHIFGRSMGGIIAQLIASEFPKRVLSACMIMSTSLRPGLPQAQPEIMQMMLAAMPDYYTHRQEFIEKRLQFIKAIAGAFKIDRDEEIKKIDLTMQRAKPANILGQVCAMALTSFDEERLKRIDVPCLIVHGTEDPVFPLACGADIAQLIPQATLLTIEGMGHTIPGALNDKIIKAFSSIIK